MASLLAFLARRLVKDPMLFQSRLREVRTRLLEEHLPTGIPLVVLSVLHRSASATVIHTTCDNFSILRAISGPGVWFLVSSYWVKFRTHFLWHRALGVLLDPFSATDRVHWLANSPAELKAAQEAGVRAHFVNHNCFVNEDAFTIVEAPGFERFSAVLNANAARWKRHELARDVPRLAYITYSRKISGEFNWPVEDFAPAYRNDHYLDEAERSRLYAAADCGLVLSACEGANYSTIEFLLCGLPVVSTPSIGGRDVWFTPRNSTVCEPTPEPVGAAVREWSARRAAGVVDRIGIRAETISRMREHRARFVGALQEILNEAGVADPAEAIFEAQRKEDRMLHALSFQKASSAHAHPACQGKAWYPLNALPFWIREPTSSRSAVVAGS